MKLTTDLSVRKWKPKTEGERASCGDSLYLQGYSNGTRAYIFRAQPIVDGKQKSFWVKLGKPAQSNGPSIVGKQLSLANAKMAVLFLKEAINSGELTVAEARKVIDKGHNVLELSSALQDRDVTAVEPTQRLHRYPTFDECYWEWFNRHSKALRWTNQKAKMKTSSTYVNHVKKHIGHVPINEVSRRMLKSVLQEAFLKVPNLAKNLRGHVEEVMEDAVDDQLIDDNPTPARKNFTTINAKSNPHGTVPAARLPELYQYVVNCNSSASFKACAVALMVTALRVSNIAFLRQEFYDPTTGKFVVPAKEGEDDPDGLMKSGNEYVGVFPDAVRRMINAQLVEGHEFVFVSPYNGRQINPESVRKLFKGFDRGMTSHGLRNSFKEWGYNNEVDSWLVDRYVDHSLQGLDKHYRRFDTVERRAALAHQYHTYMVTGVPPAPQQYPQLNLAEEIFCNAQHC